MKLTVKGYYNKIYTYKFEKILTKIETKRIRKRFKQNINIRIGLKNLFKTNKAIVLKNNYNSEQLLIIQISKLHGFTTYLEN